MFLYKKPTLGFFAPCVLTLSVCVGLVSCNQAQNKGYDDSSSYESTDNDESYDQKGLSAANMASEDRVQSQSLANRTHLTATGKERQFIKKATTSFQVEDVYKTAMTLEDMTIRSGGFVIHNEITNRELNSVVAQIDKGVQTIVAEYEPTGTLTLRVPHDKIQEFLREMVSHTEFMYARRFDAEDVVLQIVKQQQLAKVEATASEQVNTEVSLAQDPQNKDTLTDKVSAIDSSADYKRNELMSDIKKADLQDKVAFSTLSISLRQSPIIRSYSKNYFPYYVKQAKPSFQYRIKENVSAGFRYFKDLLVLLSGLIPFVLVSLGLWFVCVKATQWWRKRKQNVGK